jgi:hypothetical protein
MNPPIGFAPLKSMDFAPSAPIFTICFEPNDRSRPAKPRDQTNYLPSRIPPFIHYCSQRHQQRVCAAPPLDPAPLHQWRQPAKPSPPLINLCCGHHRQALENGGTAQHHHIVEHDRHVLKRRPQPPVCGEEPAAEKAPIAVGGGAGDNGDGLVMPERSRR